MKILAPLLIAAAVLVSACSERPGCAEIRNLASDRAFVKALERWVDDQDKKGRLGEAHSIDGRVAMPAAYRVEVDDPLLRQRLNGRGANILMGIDEDISAVFFTDQAYSGLIVKIPGRSASIVSDQSLAHLTERSAIVCIQRD